MAAGQEVGQEKDKWDEPRRLIFERSEALGLSWEHLSGLLGKNKTYVQQYIRRGSPSVLDERDRQILATALKVPSEDLLPPGFQPRPTRKKARPMSRGHSILDSMAEIAAQIPLYHDQSELTPEHTEAWPRPNPFNTPPGTMALLISLQRGRLQPGDIAYLRPGFPARAGDCVAVLKESRLVTLGDLERQTDANVTVNGKAYPRSQHIVVKVIGALFA